MPTPGTSGAIRTVPVPTEARPPGTCDTTEMTPIPTEKILLGWRSCENSSDSHRKTNGKEGRGQGRYSPVPSSPLSEATGNRQYRGLIDRRGGRRRDGDHIHRLRGRGESAGEEGPRSSPHHREKATARRGKRRRKRKGRGNFKSASCSTKMKGNLVGAIKEAAAITRAAMTVLVGRVKKREEASFFVKREKELIKKIEELKKKMERLEKQASNPPAIQRLRHRTPRKKGAKDSESKRIATWR